MSSRSGSSFFRVVAIIVIVLLAIVVAAEIGLRMFIASKARSSFSGSAEEPEVSFGASPLVFGLLGGKLSEISIDTPSTLQIDGDDISGQPAARVDLAGVKLNDSLLSDQVRISTELPDDFLLATMRTQIEKSSPLGEYVNVTDVTSHADEASFEVEFVEGLASLTLAPQARDGQLLLEASNASFVGLDLPAEVTDEINRALQQGIDPDEQLRFDDVAVVDGGLRLRLSAENLPLAELATETQPAQ